MGVSDLRSSTSPTPPSVFVDWSEILKLCATLSVLLERSTSPIYDMDRAALDAKYPVEHEDSCWLGKNYRDQPKVWKYGCDRGCLAKQRK